MTNALLALVALGLAAALFGAVLLVIESGRRIGARAMARDPVGARAGAVVNGAVFGLLGLLVAFTFSGAANRFDTRRQLVVEETNAIGTAYLRLDVLPATAQPALRARFREYLDSRLAAYRAMPDLIASGPSWRGRRDSRRRSGGAPSPRAASPAWRHPARLWCCRRSTR